MKKVAYLIYSLFLILYSCSSDDTVSEITFPSGSTNYFKTSVDFDHNANEKTISFTSTVPWQATVADTRSGNSWCSVNPSGGDAGQATLIISAAENTTYDDRSAVIRLTYGDSIKNIYVNQKQLDALTLTSNRFEIPAKGGSFEIEVKSNIDFTINTADDCKSWVHRDSSTRGLQTSTFKFNVDASEDYDKREGTIEIVSGSKKETVKIYQAGEGKITLTQKEFNINKSEQDLKIEISSNFEYTVEMPNVDWITENKTGTRGMSTHTINLHVKENTSYDSRTANLRIFDKNSDISETITITQRQKDIISIDKKEFVISEKGGTFSFAVKSNVDYQISIACDWIKETTSGTRALREKNHTFSVSALSGANEREGKITLFSETAGLSEEITVKQILMIAFDTESLALMVGKEKKINLINNSEQSIKWESSNTSVATVNNGVVKAVSKGSATITAKTADGKYSCKCVVEVKDITGFISASPGGGAIIQIGDLIQYGSQLSWYFKNNSSESVILKSIQLVDGQSHQAGNEMQVNAKIEANSSVGYTTTIGLLGIHAPVSCKFKYEYKNKIYTTEAIYSSKW